MLFFCKNSEMTRTIIFFLIITGQAGCAGYEGAISQTARSDAIFDNNRSHSFFHLNCWSTYTLKIFLSYSSRGLIGSPRFWRHPSYGLASNEIQLSTPGKSDEERALTSENGSPFAWCYCKWYLSNKRLQSYEILSAWRAHMLVMNGQRRQFLNIYFDRPCYAVKIERISAS